MQRESYTFLAVDVGRYIGIAVVNAALRLFEYDLFLEVASDNAAARALYAKAGFIQTGLRPAYYLRTTGPAADALTLTWTTPQPSWF